MYRPLVGRKIHLSRFSIILLLPLSACQQCTGGSSGGGITIAQSDGTPPTLSLGAGQPGGQNVSVSVGGSAQNMKLTSKSGALNLLASAKDGESGVQALEIWVNKKTTRCDTATNLCSQTGPGLLAKPQFESTSPKKNPGETTPDASILADALDLSKEIPQAAPSAGNTLTVQLLFFARARNHLGGQAQTPQITATWSEP
jgi:hypothetical protein